MASGSQARRLTLWSLVSLVLSLPTWWIVLRGAVMSRVVDGGIFLSVAGGMNDGLSLYSGIWDNKDPLFYGVFAGFDRLSPLFAPAVFVTDWLWLPLAALGAALLTSAVASWDRALFVGLVGTPWIVAGATYVPGWSSTPGTALALLALGLCARSRGVLGGIVVALLVFTKLALAPIGIAALLALSFVPSMRRVGIRGLVSLAVSLVAGLLALLASGSLGGYFDMLGRNRAYASAVMTYFGFADSIGGHVDKLRAEMASGMWVALAVTLVVLLLASALLLVGSWRSAPNVVVVLWSWLTVLGVLAMLTVTYVWPHHAQALALPFVMAAVLVAAIVPPRWGYPGWLPFGLVVGLLLTGWGSVSLFVDHARAIDDGYDSAMAQVDEVPLDARLLNTVPQATFRYAVLGTNDDRGFLRDMRPGATLACPQFHLYDFSPTMDFDAAWACLDTVDALVLTDNFVVFGNGGRAAQVQPILGKVGTLFDCVKVEDRQLCLRKR